MGVRVVDIWYNEYYKADDSLKERIEKDKMKNQN